MGKYKVLLINPPRIDGIAWTREGRCQERESTLGTFKPPLTLAIIASLLKKHKMNFRVIDANALDLKSDEVSNLLLREDFIPDIIIYCTTTPTVIADTKSIGIIKERFKSNIVAFGPQISGAPYETMEKLSVIDIGIIGEPEFTIMDILKQNDIANLEKVKGIIWRNSMGIYNNDPRDWIEDMNQLPIPAWDLFPIDKYKLPFFNEKYLTVETSRGCPFACEFCVTQLNHGLKFRERHYEAVVSEIEYLKGRYNIKFFNLFGDTVTFNKEFVDKFCDEVIRRNLRIKWFANTRADTIYDGDLIRKMKESGCWMLSVGIESFNEQTRRNMQKKLKMDEINNAIRLLREAGIMSFGFFIYGYPGETEKDLYETTKFALSLPLDYANFYPAVPYPGTDFYNKCMREGYLHQNSWDRMEYSYYVLKTKDLNENIVKKAISNAYLSFYLRQQFIFRHLRNVGLINFFVGSIKYGLKFLSKNLKNSYTK